MKASTFSSASSVWTLVTSLHALPTRPVQSGRSPNKSWQTKMKRKRKMKNQKNKRKKKMRYSKSTFSIPSFLAMEDGFGTATSHVTIAISLQFQLTKRYEYGEQVRMKSEKFCRGTPRVSLASHSAIPRRLDY